MELGARNNMSFFVTPWLKHDSPGHCCLCVYCPVAEVDYDPQPTPRSALKQSNPSRRSTAKKDKRRVSYNTHIAYRSPSQSPVKSTSGSDVAAHYAEAEAVEQSDSEEGNNNMLCSFLCCSGLCHYPGYLGTADRFFLYLFWQWLEALETLCELVNLTGMEVCLLFAMEFLSFPL